MCIEISNFELNLLEFSDLLSRHFCIFLVENIDILIHEFLTPVKMFPH